MTPTAFLEVLAFRNLHRCRELNRGATGRTGPFFYSDVVAIDASLAFVLTALLVARPGG